MAAPLLPAGTPAGIFVSMLTLVLTTVGNQSDALSLSNLAVEAGAACAQVDGPVQSVYRWEGRLESSEEWRVLIKVVPGQLPGVRDRVLSAHPYDTPQWVEISADFVAEKYLQWARSGR